MTPVSWSYHIEQTILAAVWMIHVFGSFDFSVFSHLQPIGSWFYSTWQLLTSRALFNSDDILIAWINNTALQIKHIVKFRNDLLYAVSLVRVLCVCVFFRLIANKIVKCSHLNHIMRFMAHRQQSRCKRTSERIEQMKWQLTKDNTWKKDGTHSVSHTHTYILNKDI